jgi:translation initiation factor 2B subunit (eIF-2B alpha/beta/delta family)
LNNARALSFDIHNSFPMTFLINSLRSAKTLRQSGIPATVISDTAVGYVIGKVDAVFVGAEGVVENGGLINAVSELMFISMGINLAERLLLIHATILQDRYLSISHSC